MNHTEVKALLVELKQPRWVMLGVSIPHGHPTYVCGNCWLQRVTITTAGAELPGACGRCLAVLEPAQLPHYADIRALMVSAGHANLLTTSGGSS